MKHQESKSAILMRHYLKANPLFTHSIENKDTRGKNYLNFSEVSEAQLNWGMAIKSDKGVLIRVVAIVDGMPDYIYLRNEPAFVIIKYPRSIEYIDVATFILEKGRSKRKSLTASRAKELSTLSIKLK